MGSKFNRYERTYHTWAAMKWRCSQEKNAKTFAKYKGRGIKVCERWAKFQNFLDDMGLRPDGRSLDRINNDGDYEPGNCRWATPSEQNLNRRPFVHPSRCPVTFEGITLSKRDWDRRQGFPHYTVMNRMLRGWSAEKAITTPLRPHPRRKAPEPQPRHSGNQ